VYRVLAFATVFGASVHEHVSDHGSPAPTRGSTFNPFCRTKVGSRAEARLSRHQRRFNRANKRQNQEMVELFDEIVELGLLV